MKRPKKKKKPYDDSTKKLKLPQMLSKEEYKSSHRVYTSKTQPPVVTFDSSR